jgi:hypothetical protein
MSSAAPVAEDESDPVNPAKVDAPGLEIPGPIARRLVASFFAVLALVIATASVAIYNKDRLPDALERYADEENARRTLTVAVLEIEIASQMLSEWGRNPAAPFDDADYALHVQTAAEMLDATQALPTQYEAARDAIAAAFKDLEMRRSDARAAVSRGERDAAIAVTSRRDAVAVAISSLETQLRETRIQSERLRTSTLQTASTLEASLAVIIGAMTLAGIFMAFVWKRLIDLH